MCAVKLVEYHEGDLVNVEPEIIGESEGLTIIYSEPINENGEWQTDYDDAGTYDINIQINNNGEITTLDSTLKIIDKNPNHGGSPLILKRFLPKQDVE